MINKLPKCAKNVTNFAYAFYVSAVVLVLIMSSGKVPVDWKCAKVSAVFKKGSKLDIGNYRPISVLPIISKVLEKLVHNQIYSFLSDNNLLCADQSGFRQHSTQTSLHNIMDDVYHSTDSGGLVGLVALDLRKAFDTVNHSILINELSYYGITDTNLSWFKSYLSDRTQVASINGSLSTSMTIETGVPQGSILGPLLFLIYLNDLPISLEHCKVNMYADDTAFYTPATMSNNICDIISSLQSDLSNVSDWLDANKLSLHIGKTCCMLVCSLKYLGVTIDQNLTYNVHVENVINKISKSLGVLTRASRVVPLQVRVTLYNTLVLPHFDYCCTLWDVCSDGHIARLQQLQNHGMRIILGCHYRTNISEMLSTLKWLNVRQRFTLLKCIMMFNIVNGKTPDYLNDITPVISHGYNTRSKSSNNVFQTFCHKKSLKHCGTSLWSNLPSHVKSQKSLISFKKYCVQYILGNLHSVSKSVS